MKVNLCPEWKEHLKEELKAPYFLELQSFLDECSKENIRVFPNENDIFQALNLVPLKNIKVVILGQDPYHGEGQAHGLAFSVNRAVKIPPSLVNIFKEISSDLNIPISSHGDLTSWAKQGVLLLNNVLTVEEKKAGSHHKKGWEKFTDKIIQIINDQKTNVVFILWGSPAQTKAKNVDKEKHYILTSVHPSPLSSYRGFFGCKHFSKTNDYLISKGLTPIDWKLPS